MARRFTRARPRRARRVSRRSTSRVGRSRSARGGRAQTIRIVVEGGNSAPSAMMTNRGVVMAAAPPSKARF